MVPIISETVSTSIAWKLFGKNFDVHPLKYTNILSLWSKKKTPNFSVCSKIPVTEDVTR